MRTTIRLDDELLSEAKQLAARTGRTLTAVIEDALRETLARSEPSSADQPFDLPTFGEGGTLPGIDLDDTSALMEAMDQGEPLDRLR
jgi:hypothetical protein